MRERWLAPGQGGGVRMWVENPGLGWDKCTLVPVTWFLAYWVEVVVEMFVEYIELDLN